MPSQDCSKRVTYGKATLNFAVVNQHELSRRIGISVSEISRIFAGKRQPRPDTIRRIAAALEVTTGDVIDSLPQVYPGN